ncbi:MAG: hypothetical protein FWC25_01355 [Dehalococcoidia bacterium]|nr:hypothetical protein [Dehalococcoidia bacterium]
MNETETHQAMRVRGRSFTTISLCIQPCKADYAVRIVDTIARSGGRMMASAIAEKAYITSSHLRKILYMLSARRLVLSYRGTY